MGDPGGGSDFAGFYNHLGIPIAEWGFGGAGGVYHSQYDSYAWMTKFGDPKFEYHAAAATRRNGDAAAHRERRRAAVRLRRVCAHDAPVHPADRPRGGGPSLERADDRAPRGDRSAGARRRVVQRRARLGALRATLPNADARSGRTARCMQVERALTSPAGSSRRVRGSAT